MQTSPSMVILPPPLIVRLPRSIQAITGIAKVLDSFNEASHNLRRQLLTTEIEPIMRTGVHFPHYQNHEVNRVHRHSLFSRASRFAGSCYCGSIVRSI